MSKNRLLKQQEAQTRQEKRDKRSPADQISALDAKFGKNLGAKKERERLLALINKKEEESKEEKPKRKRKKKNEQEE
jgi:hypothetical protein